MLIFRLILAISLSLTLGACDRFRTPPTIEPRPDLTEAELHAFYCDQTTLFRWTDEEWAVRVARFPENLRAELQVNERRRTWECSNG
jgi:hypothetical protein